MTTYTLDQTEAARRAFKAIAAIPVNKRLLAELLADTFISGMAAQEQICSSTQAAPYGRRA